MVSCLCRNSNSERAFTWTRQNIIKTHTGPVGNRCIVESHYVCFDGKSMNLMHKGQKTIRKKIIKKNPTKSNRCPSVKDEDNVVSLIKEKKQIYCNADLCEDIFILHNQWVGINMSREEVLSVAFCAPLGPALNILCTWGEAKGNQSEVNYNHLLSNSTLHALELNEYTVKFHSSESALRSGYCLNNDKDI